MIYSEFQDKRLGLLGFGTSGCPPMQMAVLMRHRWLK